jgi:uncharacterized protein (TIGR00369 family)
VILKLLGAGGVYLSGRLNLQDAMTDLLTFGRGVLDSQPFSRLLGTQLLEFEEGKAVLELYITANLKQQHDFVHGGVVSYLADNCLTFAGGSVLGDSVTSEYKINYVRPAIGEKLIATAWVQHQGTNQAVCRCEVVVADGETQKTVALAQGTITKIRKET